MNGKNKILEPAGMKAGKFFRLSPQDLIKLPEGSEIFTLPRRRAIGFDPETLSFREEKSRSLPIAAFLTPGYTVTYNSAYIEMRNPRPLPLFAYAACSLHKGEIYTAAVRVDRRLCHDARFIDMHMVKKNALKLKKIFPENRLVKHLERCALRYGCPNAKNFFLSRYEAPLPVSPACNAGCAGCISYQARKAIPVTQPRIRFIPTPEEIAEIALFHIGAVKKPIVSFGQGCEGEPLVCADIINKAIMLIRAKTSKGVINMNTNASSPVAIGKLFDSGLDSIRVSLNSAREKYYNRYYRPRGYSFKDVLRSIDVAKKKKAFVSVNYLTMPGFTDSRAEFSAFKKLLWGKNIDMIQWRNLNFDPLGYFKVLKVSIGPDEMLGVKEIIYSLKKEFPSILMGYFNINVKHDK